MRILLDECVNAGIKRAFTNHVVRTVPEMVWSGIKNGNLLALIAGQFDVFLTIDQNLRHQQNMSGLSFATLFIRVPNNMIESYRPLFDLMERTVSALAAGEILVIP